MQSDSSDNDDFEGSVNVLIVDDNEMTRALLRSILSAEGYIVQAEASNSKNGLEQILRLKPTIVFLDIQLPDGSGVDILKQVMTDLPKTIALMVTGMHDVETVKTCLGAGAKGFIIKPFNSGVVLKTVKDALARAGLQPPKV
jgi:two-component system chemotaxis response regulator CheY